MRQEDGNIRALLRNTWRLYVKLVHVTFASFLTTSNNNQFKKQIERICKPPPDEGTKSPSLYVMQRHEESTEQQACESSSENEKSAQQPLPQPHQRDPFTVTVTTYSKCNCDGCEKLAAKKDYFVRHNRPNPAEWPGPGPGSVSPPAAESEKVFTITSTTSATKYPKLHISEKQPPPPPPPLFDKLSPTTSSSGESDSRIYTKDEIKSKLDDLDNSKILKRERNRLAARRCRQNQRDRISILERDVRDMESANGIVQQEIQLLQSQAKQLSGMLLNHKCVLKLSSSGGGNDIKQVYTTKHSQQ